MKRRSRSLEAVARNTFIVNVGSYFQDAMLYLSDAYRLAAAAILVCLTCTNVIATSPFQTTTASLGGDPFGIMGIDIDHRWFGFQAGRDRDFTGLSPNVSAGAAYDYSVHLIKDGDSYRMFHGGRFRDQLPDGTIVDGDHIFSRQITTDAFELDPTNWTDVTPTLYSGQEVPSPLWIQPQFQGDPGNWYSNNYLEPEVIKTNGTYYLYSQLEIKAGETVDTGETAIVQSDRIQLHTSTDGTNWTRANDQLGVIRNITAPQVTDLGHQEVIYVPSDPDNRAYWMYFRYTFNGNFQGHLRIRSADPTAFDWNLREVPSGLSQIGNQIGYFEDYVGERMFTRITFRENSEQRQVPTLQFSRDGLNWFSNSGMPLELLGSEDNLNNQNNYFLGISTVDGTGQLEEIAQQTYRVIYASSTANSAEAPEIFDAEIGLGEMILSLPVLVPGDYTQDQIVDHQDLLKWFDTFGSTTEFAADGDRDGDVDGSDFLFWQRNFSPAEIIATQVAVPEPSSIICIAMFLFPWLMTARQ